MLRKSLMLAGLTGALAVALAACQTPQDGTNTTDSAAAPAAATDSATDATTPPAETSGGTGTGTGIPSLVSVNLQNVLNDLSVAIKVDRANIPVNAQIPIDVAANVCGVSVSVLGASTGGQASCTAKTATPELAQVVQQQISAGGDVGGGAQGGSTATTGTSTQTDTTTPPQ